MKLIDKLYYKVQTQGERLIMAFISLDETRGQYIADCRLWDGVKGSGTRSIMSEHSSEREAREAIDRVAKQYPGEGRVMVLIDDLDE